MSITPGGPVSSDFSVFVRVDYPEKPRTELKIAKETTIAQFFTAAAKALSLPADDLSRYRPSIASYGTDVIEIEKNKTSQSIAEAGATSGSTVLLAAPGDIKPARTSKKKKAEAEEKSGGVRADIYKGFTPQNALTKLQEAKAGKPRQLALEYTDIFIADISKTAAWAKLPKATVAEILARDWLSAEEGVIFEAALVWGRAELKRAGETKTEAKVDLKSVMGDIVNLIRFPCMDVSSIASKVNASGLLASQQLLDLFTYVGAKAGSKDTKLPESLQVFKAKPRTPRKKPDNFLFSEAHKHTSCTISEKGLRVTGTGSNQTVAGDIIWDKGVHEFEWEITSGYAMFGFVPADYSNFNSGSHIGDSTFRGWALYAYSTWQIYRLDGASSPPSSQSSTMGTPLVIGVRLDLDKKEVEFFRNGLKGGQSTGIVMRDIQGPVRPAVTIYSNAVINIRNL